MSERLSHCPLCKSGNFLNHLEVKDHAVSKKKFTLCRCAACELIFTNPRPKAEDIGPYYDFPEYYSHEDRVQSFTSWVYKKIRNYSLKKKVALLSSFVQKGSVLDYGCGTGELLQEAKRQQWQVLGVEPNEKARAQALHKLPEQVYPSLSDITKETDFDVITLFHVLEHIHDLRKTIKILVSILKSSAYLIVAVPNPLCADAKYYGTNWAAWDVPRHLYHFSENSMTHLAEEFGLELVDTKPMVFDSYYVSLLSEGYKSPKSSTFVRYIRALYQGYLSNRRAKRAGNYSSNVFIFKKR